MKKAALKTAGISMDGYKSKPSLPAPADMPSSDGLQERSRRPFTGIGFNTLNANVSHELADARQRLADFDGATLVRALDPSTIRRSRFANRILAEFQTSEFRQLKDEISSSGGNVQPIKVRSIKTAPDAIESDTARYEIAFGHRRHQACLELGLRVNAVIDDDMSDLELFEAMDRENRGRKSLSAWEQGRMYQEALEQGLYPSERRLAETLGVNQSNVNRAIKLAKLPTEVVMAFSSPLDLQVRWQKPLTDALQKDPDGVLARARDLAKNRGVMGPAQVLDRLIARAEPETSTSSIKIGDRTVGTMSFDTSGRVSIELDAGHVVSSDRQALIACLERFLREKA